MARQQFTKDSGAVAATKVLTGGFNQAVDTLSSDWIENANQAQNEINDIADESVGVTSLDQISNLMNRGLARTNYTASDLRTATAGSAAGQILGAGFQGALEGIKMFGPWGAFKGVADILGSSIGYGIGQAGASKAAQKLNYEAKKANQYYLTQAEDSVMNIGKNIANNAWLNVNSAALGGPLDTTFTNGVRFITEGGSHESNPLSGVPQGIASDGIPNLVEEGEVIYKDYVYSKRLKVPQGDKEVLGLKKGKDYTYAEAAEQIQKESEERPNDPVSKQTLDEMMGRLQGSQEALKEKRDGQALKKAVNSMTPDELAMFMQQLQQPQQMQPMMAMQGMQPMQPTQSEVPMFGKGGLLGHKHALDKVDQTGFLYTFKDTQPTDIGIQFDENGQPTYDIIGDWGYTRPADIGDGKGIITRADENGRTQYAILNRDPRDYGNALKYKPLYNKEGKEIGGNYEIVPRELPQNSEESELRGNRLAQALRAAPVFGSLASSIASLFDKPNYSNIARAERAAHSVPRVGATPIGQRMAYTPIDINYIATQQANNALGARRALAEYGAGNPAGIQQAVIANNYANQTAFADALMKANQLNRQNLAQALEFNRQTDSTNVGNDLQADLANQQRDMSVADFLFRTGQLRDAELARVQANRSTNITGLYNALGNLGTDMLNREQAAAVAASLGVTYNDLMKALALTSTGKNIGAKGGKLNIKKGGKDA